jgi:hypothetical protein
MSKARESLEFWMQNSVHASEQPDVAGDSQRPEELKADALRWPGARACHWLTSKPRLVTSTSGPLWRLPTMKTLRMRCAVAGCSQKPGSNGNHSVMHLAAR